jgi:small subunit ribosomal protein S5
MRALRCSAAPSSWTTWTPNLSAGPLETSLVGSRYPHSSGERSELADRVVRVNRVAKVVKGGRKFSFSALIVVGDMNGRVGAGIGKAREVTEAIRKGMEVAKRNMITVPMVGTTIPHEVRLKLGSAKIMLKPAAPGTGVISGGAMRAVIETAGIKDILTKSHGTNNPINTVRATLAALQQLRTVQQIAELRGKEVEQIVGRRLANIYRKAEGKADAAATSGAPEISNGAPK